MRNWKPIFVENSIVPVILSKIAPIEIEAITLGFVVFARGKLPQHIKTHETIHFQQFLETLFIPFVLIYFYDYIKNYIILRDGKLAYYNIRAEQEAHVNHGYPSYPAQRKRYQWLKGGSQWN
tara:strand:- start:712 stop:1077 length:366 start_codon:yes stop_codon:yes gene_type:complete